MDVRCTRCGTEYEFDDALISERGTSVRCTQCGFQFKVFPPQLVTVGPDEWIVLTSLGQRVVYRSLRELQNGIAKSEVAREDLLARGSKPPRPLGSIAELDPLFTIKAAPERKPSTLTGVAPPPPRAGAPAAVEPPGRPPHDTFSGVAPPANSPPIHASPTQDPQAPLVVQPGAPVRGGGTRTVLGIGSSNAQFSATSSPMRIPEAAIPSTSAPPETRSFDALAQAATPENPDDATGPGPRAVPAISNETALVNSEPPTNRPPASTEANSQARELSQAVSPADGVLRAGAKPPLDHTLDETTVAIVSTSETASSVPVVPGSSAADPPRPRSGVEPSSGDPARLPVQDAAKSKALLGRVQLERKQIPVAATVSDPPTERWAGQSPAQHREPSQHADTGGEQTSPDSGDDDLQSTTLAEEPQLAAKLPPVASLPATTRSREAKAVEAPEVSVASTARPQTESVPEANQGDDATTLPPARPHPKTSRASASTAVSSKTLVSGQSAAVGARNTSPHTASAGSSRMPWGRIGGTLALLGLGLFAGMKIVGSQLQKPVTPVAPVEPQASASARQIEADWVSALEQQLMIGDVSTAEQLLAAVDERERDKITFRSLQARTHALAADMVWWKIQLIGRAAGDVYARSKQQLAALSEQLNQDFGAVGTESEWSEQVLAAWLDARRTQGEKGDPTNATLLERLKNPSTPALKYTQLVSEWVRHGVPEDKTIEGLRQIRPKGLDLGPHAVARVVALTQLNRFDEANRELKGLASQSRAHPLYEEMLAYVRTAEQAQVEAPADVARDAGVLADSNEAPEIDPDLAEADFRVRLTRAIECLSRNELTKAQRLLRSVLAQRPNDTEAITAMGDVSRRRGSMTQARSLYDKALSLNGNYLPALSGAADVRWRSGDRAGAAAFYRRITERVGEGPGYGQVAAARLKEIEAAPKATPEPEPAAAASVAREPKAKPKDPK